MIFVSSIESPTLLKYILYNVKRVGDSIDKTKNHTIYI